VAVTAGRVDHQSAGALEAALKPLVEQSRVLGGTLVIDLAGVEYISSVGLRVLMIAAKELRTSGAKIAVAALQPVVAEIFAISRFDRVLGVFPTVRSALEFLAPRALAAFDASQPPAPA